MNGIINILKPPMMTSNSVVAAVKKYSGQAHVGHTGTLDPNAAGVLPICIGKATKLAEYFLADEKEYIGEILFGVETDSCDTEGNVILKSDNIPSRGEIEAALPSFLGDIIQYPPTYSAIKINGRKAYELARNNEEVNIPPRNVSVEELEILSFTPPNRAVIRVKCSKGTYIRSLARDIGRYLNSAACLSMLVRTKCGVFDIESAVTLDEVRTAFAEFKYDSVLLNPSVMLDYLPIITFSEKWDKKLVCGNPVAVKYADFSDKLTGSDIIRIICNSKFIGTGKLVKDQNGDELIQPTKVIAD